MTTLAATGVFRFSWLLLAFPVFGAAVLLLGGRRTDKWGHLLGVADVAGVVRLRRDRVLHAARQDRGRAAARTCTCTPGSRSNGFQANIGILLDPLSICFVLLITGVGSLILIYSVGYMAHDPERRRFFGYLNLFIAAMLLLVISDNYLGLYVGLGGRRPRLLPADRVLAVQADARRSRPRRRSSPTASVTPACRWRSC